MPDIGAYLLNFTAKNLQTILQARPQLREPLLQIAKTKKPLASILAVLNEVPVAAPVPVVAPVEAEKAQEKAD